jgi:threonine dehydratase
MIAAKTLNSKIKVVGVQSEGAPSMYNSWKAGRILELDSIKTIADGLAARKPSELTFKIVRDRIDDILLVSDQEIGLAVMKLLKDANIPAEPSGAAPLAALSKYDSTPRERIALIITGRNISMRFLADLLRNC